MVLWGGLDVVFGSALLAGLGNVSFEPVCSGVLSVGVWCRVWLAIVVCSVGLVWRLCEGGWGRCCSVEASASA